MPVTPLKIAIVTSGKRQREIAEALGVHESTVSRWANGLHCDEATRAAIAGVLGRQIDELWPSQDRTAA